jgi:hypothetical protein
VRSSGCVVFLLLLLRYDPATSIFASDTSQRCLLSCRCVSTILLSRSPHCAASIVLLQSLLPMVRRVWVRSNPSGSWSGHAMYRLIHDRDTASRKSLPPDKRGSSAGGRLWRDPVDGSARAASRTWARSGRCCIRRYEHECRRRCPGELILVAVVRLSVRSSRSRDGVGAGGRVIDPSCRAVWHLTL